MEKPELYERFSKSDLFLAEHYEELFYLAPKELAIAINAMNEGELLQFNQTIQNGDGRNVDLMQDKLDELSKYLGLNIIIFGEAILRTSVLDALISAANVDKDKYEETFYKSVRETKEYFTGNNKNSGAIKSYIILFSIYPAFREHFFKLKRAGIIEETETGLKWNRDKISIAEYFECLECRERNRRWKYVEDIFGYHKLPQYLNVHKKQQRKPSKAFEEIKSLLGLNNQ
jgi:hypothetical protein